MGNQISLVGILFIILQNALILSVWLSAWWTQKPKHTGGFCTGGCMSAGMGMQLLGGLHIRNRKFYTYSAL